MLLTFSWTAAVGLQTDIFQRQKSVFPVRPLAYSRQSAFSFSRISGA
jgi:hypothetical protein